jgi:hypothetical protein
VTYGTGVATTADVIVSAAVAYINHNSPTVILHSPQGPRDDVEVGVEEVLLEFEYDTG